HHPLRKPRTLALAAPCPLPSMRRCRCDTKSAPLGASDHHWRVEAGEPLREGRLWRSRRSGRRGRVGGVGSTLAAAPGCPALTTWVRHAEALSAAAHPASTQPSESTKDHWEAINPACADSATERARRPRTGTTQWATGAATLRRRRCL